MRSSREYPKHPLIGVGGLIHRGGKLLLIKRRFEPNKGRWSLPGGLMEVGEDPAGAARREVKEEVGLDVKVEGLFQVANEVIRDGSGRVKYHFVLIDYLMSPKSRRVTLNAESSEYGWFEPEAVGHLDSSDNTRKIAKRFMELESGRAFASRR